MNRLKLFDLLRIPDGELPQARLRKGGHDLAKLMDHPDSFISDLATAQLKTAQALTDVLSTLSAEIPRYAQSLIQQWQANDEMMSLLDEVASLPTSAGEGYMKLKGYLPTKIDQKSSLRYAALLLLYTARALFLGERKGFDSILSSVSARGFSYSYFLSENNKALIEGFHPLYSILQSPYVASSIYSFSSQVGNQFIPLDRAFAFLCITRQLMLSAGLAGSTPANGSG
ncbi:MAG: hypothetical protein V4805_07640 [Pseudomonadota bacterium]